jgi:hypothetical protein
MKLYAQAIGYVALILVLFGLIGWHTVHIWSDCLGEHSVLTCMRMLGR